MATAKALTKGLKGIGIRTDQRLREQHFGDFQGKTFPEIAEIVGSDKFGEYAAVVKGVGGADLTFPNGENQLHVLERSLQAVQEIARAHEGETVLVVTHGVVLQTLLKHFLGIPVTEPRTFATINTALNIVEADEGGSSWSVRTLGDTSHQEEGGAPKRSRL